MEFDWVFLGDSSRYDLVKGLFPDFPADKDISDYSIAMTQEDSFTLEEKVGVWNITTPLLLPGQTIYVPIQGEEIPDRDMVQFRQGAYFEGYPFGRASTHEFYKENWRFECGERPFLVVLTYRAQGYASSDADTPEESLDKAKDLYKTTHINCITIKAANDVIQVLGWRESPIRSAALQIQEIADYFHDTFHADGSIFSNAYQNAVYKIKNEVSGEWSVKKKDSRMDFKTIRNGTDVYLWGRYRDAVEETLFSLNKENGLAAVLESYMEVEKVLYDQLPLFTMDMVEERRQRVWKQLQIEWKSYMAVPSKYKKSIPAIALNSDFEFAKYRRTAGFESIAIDFRKRVTGFIEQRAKEVILAILEEEYQELERRIQKYE